MKTFSLCEVFRRSLSSSTYIMSFVKFMSTMFRFENCSSAPTRSNLPFR